MPVEKGITRWKIQCAFFRRRLTPGCEAVVNQPIVKRCIFFTSVVTSGGTWNTGDTDGDGDVDSRDLTTAIINFTSARNAATAVPEPSGLVMLVLAVGCLVVARVRA